MKLVESSADTAWERWLLSAFQQWTYVWFSGWLDSKESGFRRRHNQQRRLHRVDDQFQIITYLPAFIIHMFSGSGFWSNRGEYTKLPTQNSVFPENGIKMVSDKFPDTEKVVAWTAFFMNFLCFYRFQASKQAVLRRFSPTFKTHPILIALFPLYGSGRLWCTSKVGENQRITANFDVWNP